MITKEVNERLVCTSRGSQCDDVSDPGAIRGFGLCNMSAGVRVTTGRDKTYLAALQGGSAFRPKTGPLGFVQHFTKERNEQFFVTILGMDEAGGITVRGPFLGSPTEVLIKLELRERILSFRESFKAGGINAIGGIPRLK